MEPVLPIIPGDEDRLVTEDKIAVGDVVYFVRRSPTEVAIRRLGDGEELEGPLFEVRPADADNELTFRLLTKDT